MEIPLCGEGSINQTSFHATCHDVSTKVSPFVTNINHTWLLMFLTKQYQLVRVSEFGKD
jgi:hypothetical protein